MKSVICTLFEGHYHYGLAGLINSLHKNGFKGSLFAGYKGVLPSWADTATENLLAGGQVMHTLLVANSISLNFVKVTSDYHLTNYKPDFMLSVLQYEPDADAIFYYDPDIVQDRPWTDIEEWVDYGVAVCEDINSPLAEFHPIRAGWRNYFSKHGLQLKYKGHTYANGGFVGVSKKTFLFLEQWKQVQEVMALELGGLNKTLFNGAESMDAKQFRTFALFGKTDQDALNAALEVTEYPISMLPKSAMCFSYGMYIIPHALGSPKPWRIHPMKAWLMKGMVPKYVDSLYWDNVTTPIKPHSDWTVRRKKTEIKLATFLSRFYRRP